MCLIEIQPEADDPDLFIRKCFQIHGKHRHSGKRCDHVVCHILRQFLRMEINGVGMTRHAVAEGDMDICQPFDVVDKIKRHISSAELSPELQHLRCGIILPELKKCICFDGTERRTQLFKISAAIPAAGFFHTVGNIIQKIDFQAVQSEIAHQIAQQSHRVIRRLTRRIQERHIAPGFTAQFTAVAIRFFRSGIFRCGNAREKRRDPQQIFQTETLCVFHMFFEIRQFFSGHGPVADIPVPAFCHFFRADPFHFRITPAVIHDECAESELCGKTRIFIQILIGECGMDRIPGAVNGLKRIGTELRFPFRQDDLAPIFRKEIPADLSERDQQIERLCFLSHRHRYREGIRAAHLIHLKIDQGIIGNTAQCHSRTVALVKIKKCHIGNIALLGGCHFTRPGQFHHRAVKPFPGRPHPVHINDRNGKFHHQPPAGCRQQFLTNIQHIEGDVLIFSQFPFGDPASCRVLDDDLHISPLLFKFNSVPLTYNIKERHATDGNKNFQKNNYFGLQNCLKHGIFTENNIHITERKDDHGLEKNSRIPPLACDFYRLGRDS